MIAHGSYVMCDECGDPAEMVVTGWKDARAAATHQGFTKTEDGRDLCPNCAAKETNHEG